MDNPKRVRLGHIQRKTRCEAQVGNVFALRKQLEELPAHADLAPQLCTAAGFGRVDYVRILLEYRVSPDWPSSSVGAQRNALHEACLWPEGEPVVALLLEHRANPNLTAKLNSKNMNAYQMALHKRNEGAADMIECALKSYRCGSGEGVWSSAETRLRTKQSNKSDGSEAEDTPELVYLTKKNKYYICVCFIILFLEHSALRSFAFLLSSVCTGFAGLSSPASLPSSVEHLLIIC